MTADEWRYQGSELQLFAGAHNWKAYFASQLEPHISGDVLEVGSGIGSTTRVLHGSHVSSWTALEPDAELSRLAEESVGMPAVTHLVGTLADLDRERYFDTIVYIDVLEHIGEDRAEVAAAADRLLAGGKLIVLGPAHQWLFSAFDTAVGHFRRYDRDSDEQLTPSGLILESVRFYDSLGVLASAGNRFLLKSSRPSPRLIRLWDRLLVPVSRMLDPLLGWRVGRSIVAVWARPPVV
jgi:SAM-dependent methyltransferase